jgi:hypothetical protein
MEAERGQQMRTWLIWLALAGALIAAGPAAQEDSEPRVKNTDQGQMIVWDYKSYGPHPMVILHGVYENEVAFSFKDENDQWHVWWGEKKYGPFPDMMCAGVFEGKLLFYYTENGMDFYVRWGEKKQGPFAWVWKLYYDPSDNMAHYSIRLYGRVHPAYWDGS